ncbi:hypothetical protein DERP_001942, partial [Dermatophagoides pteronyssinus]
HWLFITLQHTKDIQQTNKLKIKYNQLPKAMFFYVIITNDNFNDNDEYSCSIHI